MESTGAALPAFLPDAAKEVLQDVEGAFGARVRVFPQAVPGDRGEPLYESPAVPVPEGDSPPPVTRRVLLKDGGALVVEVLSVETAPPDAVADVLASALYRAMESEREVRFFTHELSERYEEINLLYSISETLGSILHLDEAARVILGEVCDVMGALRGSLWVFDAGDDHLHIIAEFGAHGVEGPLSTEDPDRVTSTVFREGRSVIASRTPTVAQREHGLPGDSFLSVPIRYTPPTGESRTVGVINLIGRKEDDRFNAADQKLLAAIASQVGAALENNRLIQESLSKERMAREMELAHDLQQKLLPDAGRFSGARAAARVVPAEQVGGDFYQLFKLPAGRIGVMLGDVSQHGFPSALIMTLTMSAAAIYARESPLSPAQVLRDLDDALREELETTEMFLTVFYGVLDPAARTLIYSNAGHPHAFVMKSGGEAVRLTATDPPVGFAGPDAYQEEVVSWDRDSDTLVLFTDGLPDNLASATRGDGEARILEAVRLNQGEDPARIVEALFTLPVSEGSALTGDDRTAMVLRT
ncbi:MAG: SpoIIE family protein phosphatase [Gemmatimonadota bacterium]|nr:SpoIIE family protein phosphatase [Gemmatimonadota bacterium]